MIPIYVPNIVNYKTSAIDAINSEWISNHGIYVKKSTDKLAEILNVKHCILMANGTCATHCLFLALKYKYKDISKIYVPNNCYVAAWNALVMEYDKSVMEVMKMNLDTWNICTDEEYIKTLDKNAAVLIVHNLGNIVNVPKLKRIRPDLIFVEDNCEGLFGKYDNIFSGASHASLCSAVSFYGNKTITTGEGGAFITNDSEVYNYINKAYSQGLSNQRYLHDTHAYNYRMTNIQAGFLYDQLNDIKNILENKKKLFETYRQLLQPLINENKVALFKKDENTENADWIFALRIINNPLSIEETFEFLKVNGMDSRPFFYPINSHGHFKDILFDDDNSFKLNKDVVMIPSTPTISLKEQQLVVNIITKLCFYIETGYKIIEVDNTNKELLETFIPKMNCNTFFRYFKKRDINIIQNHIVTLLIMDNDVHVGYVHIDHDDKYWFGIYIDDLYQNRGLGNKIMKYLLYHYHYKTKDLSEIHLTVDNDNERAIKLYKKHDFVEIKKNEKRIFMKKVL